MTASPRYDADVRPGMLVHLRRRLWRVDDVLGDVVTATPIDDFSARPQRFARELEVIAPGTLSAPSLQSLGDYALQRLFLQAVRLDALHGTAPFVSVQRVGVIPAEYQIVPLVMALRQQPTRLLIADTTGLGKTIEAGLIMKELLARSQARSVLILTPANLREQWQQQMRDLFYLDFEIMSSDTRKRLERSIPPGADAWLYFDHLIVSMDYAKDNRVRQELLKRKWDVVVVDEAHNAAMPHLQSGRKADMERWEAVSRIAERASKHLLLLTATPHNGYTDSYSSLLKMLSPELVTGEGAELKPSRERATLHVCQRTRTDVQRWFQEAGRSFPFPERETSAQTEVAVTLDKAYMNVLETLDAVLHLVASHAQLARQQQPVEWLRLHLHRRALSSPEALLKSLENRIERLKRVKDTPVLIEEETQEDDTLLLGLTDQGSEDAETEGETDRRADTILLRIDQQIQLTSFADLLQKLRAFKPKSDRKLAKLRDEVIPALLKKADERTPAKIIVFTRYKDTLNYLERELGRQSEYEVLPIHGDMSQAMRDEQFRKLAAAERAVLLATDVISEGLNLQAVSAMVVNYDIPWNPNRLEQRSGRIDRFGQTAPKVYIRTLYCKDTTDEQVMDLLIRKLETMREDLGACPPLFASDATIDRLVQRRKKKPLSTPGQTLSIFDMDAQADADTADDDLILRAVERIKSDGFYGQANVRITEVSDRLKAAYARFGTPEQIHAFVEAGLRRYGCSVADRGDGAFRIEINNPRLQTAGIPRLLELAVLNPNLRQNHPEATVLDVGHPLVRRLNAVIREDALKTAAEGARTAAYFAAGQSGTILIGHGLLRAVACTTPPTLLEEVIVWGIRSGLTDGQPSVTVLSLDEAQQASERVPGDKPVERESALRRLQTLQSNPAWEQAQDQAVCASCDNLKAYRTKIEADLATAGASAQEWLQGFDNVEMVGFDLYCLTLLLPEAR